MKEPEISGAALDKLVGAAAGGSRRALASLMKQPWLYLLLNTMAEWAWRRYKVVHDKHGRDVQDVVADKIRRKITSLKNGGNGSWRACLRAWCYSVTRHHCLDVIRDRRLEDAYRDSVLHENTGSMSNGKRTLAPCSPSESEEAERERRESVEEAREALLGRVVREVRGSFTPEGQRLISLWAEMKTLKQMADETGGAVETVRRHLRRLQMALVEGLLAAAEEMAAAAGKEVSVEQVIESLLARRAGGLRELVAVCLREESGRGPRA